MAPPLTAPGARRTRPRRCPPFKIFHECSRNSPFSAAPRGPLGLPHRATIVPGSVMWMPEGPPKKSGVSIASGKYRKDGIDGRDQRVEPHLAAVAIEHGGFPIALQAATRADSCVRANLARWPARSPLALCSSASSTLAFFHAFWLHASISVSRHRRRHHHSSLLTEDPLDAVPRGLVHQEPLCATVRWPGDTARSSGADAPRPCARITHDRSALPIKPGHDEARRS